MKKYFFTVILGAIIWVILSGGCERDRRGNPIKLYVQNNSSDTIIAVTQYNYPDTSLQDFRKTPNSNYSIVIPAHTKGELI